MTPRSRVHVTPSPGPGNNVRAPGTLLSAATLLLSAACAPALREPPAITALGERSGAPITTPASAAEVPTLLADAERLFSRRPDMHAVTQAYGAFLSAARADASRVEGLLGAARVAAWMIEHEPDEGRRSVLSLEAVQAGQLCLERASSAASGTTAIECTYRLALALGQQARERRSTAKDGLDRMVGLLQEVIEQAPRLDKAGGHRVLALMLLRAPGWPAGPGDPETALEHARKADELVPNDADNLMVLAEALAENAFPAESRAAYERAVVIARERAAAGDPDAADIIAAAAQALGRLRD